MFGSSKIQDAAVRSRAPIIRRERVTFLTVVDVDGYGLHRRAATFEHEVLWMRSTLAYCRLLKTGGGEVKIGRKYTDLGELFSGIGAAKADAKGYVRDFDLGPGEKFECVVEVEITDTPMILVPGQERHDKDRWGLLYMPLRRDWLVNDDRSRAYIEDTHENPPPTVLTAKKDVVRVWSSLNDEGDNAIQQQKIISAYAIKEGATT